MSDLSDFTPCPLPGGEGTGRYVRLEPIDWARHGEGLAEALAGTEAASLWRHVALGPFRDAAEIEAAFRKTQQTHGWRMMVILDADGERALGTASYMRLRPEHGSCEVGSVIFSRALQRTRGATEAMFLMADAAFALGYRRYEWKCDASNDASRRAALRLGFTYEGLFRNDMVMKGRNRDTAWFSIIDTEWPARRARLIDWLDPANFDQHGMQKTSLNESRPEAV